MASLSENVELGEIAVIGIVILIAGYYLTKAGTGIGAALSNWWNGATGGASAGGASVPDQLSAAFSNLGIGAPSTGAIAAQTAAGVAQAGGTPAQAQSAAQQVTQFATNAQPLSWQGTSVPSSTVIPGTASDIYTLRADGYSDAEITQMLNDAQANPSAYDDGSQTGTLADQGVYPSSVSDIQFGP